MKRILITGSNGLLGQKLLKLFSKSAYQKKYKIIACSRGDDRYIDTGYDFISLDITDQDAVEKVISEQKPDYVIHTAAITRVDDCENDREKAIQTNQNATTYLLAACEKIGSFFLYVSTDFIFSGEKSMLIEEDEAEPVNFYGETKLWSEKATMKYKHDWAIARTVLVYGVVKDMSRSNLLLWVEKSLKNNTPIKVVSDQWRTPTYADDLALGCALIIENHAKGIFHISGEELMTPYDMAIQTADYLGLDKNLISATNASEFKEVGKRPPKTGFNIQKAKTTLGFQPLSFFEGMKKMFEETSIISKSEY
ncbi:SDR family oxidoreductase [Sediminitomix flava]|uniref:dTDP-4-dehydrorhamnose reductase n=1 Tax=Sediminitomix flava TaxID=379075 RepID=A0A315ZHV6_SEDFL|nr:SDR family oxidoreductase [Sediminitomix flava]PWJ44892.1 dTDP-4-dehydrorhamnose reductase [Sediminitomix flava]